jgi:D-inositol-3-phosphate glycosyltransferase
LEAGPVSKLSKEELPAHIGALMSAFTRHQLGKPHDYYDLLHSHYWISGQLGWLISERTGAPLVHNMHTTAKVKNLSLAEGDAREPLIRELGEQQIVDNANALITNTDAEAAALVSLYGARPGKVHVVTPGVDLDQFKSENRPAHEKFTVSFVGRIQPHKGPEVLVRAAAEIINLAPQLRSKLDFAIMGDNSGAGHNELARLKNLVKFLKIEDVVRFVPPVKRSELPDWYRASDLVCMPSHSESFGLVALEAQACGTPVVASAVGGLRTAVADGISGVLVDGHDPMAWASVISRLLLDSKRREWMSAGALQHAKNFSWESTAKKTLAIYQQLLDGGRSALKIVN